MKYSGLIAGLGNPGQRYAGTRHNCGFMFIDRLLEKAKNDGTVNELPARKFHAEAWQVRLPTLEGCWLAVKPQTFMNESGKAIQPLLAFNNLAPEDLIVAQDELDIPPGSLRFKFGGGLAGHNGLASIKECCGSPDFYRLRIGVGKPAAKEDVINWVLAKPDPEARKLIDAAILEAINVFITFGKEGLQAASLEARNFKSVA